MDGQSIAEFEANLSGNLYKLWNRLSSGSYFPSAGAEDAPGIMHLMQFALGMMGEDEPSLRPIFAGVDPHCRRW